jgi:hypothetical protein
MNNPNHIFNFAILENKRWYVERKPLEHSLYIAQDNDNAFTRMFDKNGQINFKPFHKVIDEYFLKTFGKPFKRNGK